MSESNQYAPDPAILEQAIPTLRSFFATAKHVFLMRLDADGVIRYANTALERFLKFNTGTVLGKALAELLTAPDAAQVTARYRDASPVSPPMILNFVDQNQMPQTALCRLSRMEDGHFLLVAEAFVEDINTLHLELLQLNNQLSVLSRENSRKSKELSRALKELKEANERIAALAFQDPLTMIANRRSLVATLESEIERSTRLNLPLSLIMLDVDHFKSINDTYGHIMGDKVLIALAKLISTQVRPYDLVARYGGEEFVVVLPGVSEPNAADFAERFRKAIAAMKIPGLPQQTTASFGVTTYAPGDAVETLFERADSALYQAKAAGRNRVVLSVNQAS